MTRCLDGLMQSRYMLERNAKGRLYRHIKLKVLTLPNILNGFLCGLNIKINRKKNILYTFLFVFIAYNTIQYLLNYSLSEDKDRKIT